MKTIKAIHVLKIMDLKDKHIFEVAVDLNNFGADEYISFTISFDNEESTASILEYIVSWLVNDNLNYEGDNI